MITDKAKIGTFIKDENVLSKAYIIPDAIGSGESNRTIVNITYFVWRFGVYSFC